MISAMSWSGVWNEYVAVRNIIKIIIFMEERYLGSIQDVKLLYFLILLFYFLQLNACWCGEINKSKQYGESDPDQYPISFNMGIGAISVKNFVPGCISLQHIHETFLKFETKIVLFFFSKKYIPTYGRWHKAPPVLFGVKMSMVVLWKKDLISRYSHISYIKNLHDFRIHLNSWFFILHWHGQQDPCA